MIQEIQEIQQKFQVCEYPYHFGLRIVAQSWSTSP